MAYPPSQVAFLMKRRFPVHSDKLRRVMADARKIGEADTSDDVVDAVIRIVDPEPEDMWANPDERVEIERHLDSEFAGSTAERRAYERVRCFIDQVLDYAAELRDLSEDEFRERFRAEKAKEAAEDQAEREERDLWEFFNEPRAEAEFDKWLARRSWTIDEAVALSFGKEPSVVHWEALRPAFGIRKSPFATRFAERRELALSAVRVRELPEAMTPTQFVKWARRNHLAMSPQLSAVSEQGDDEDGEPSDIHGNTLHHLYALILGMAVQKYDFNPRYGAEVTSSAAFKEIEESVKLAGIPISYKFIKKHLSAAAAWGRGLDGKIAKKEK